MIDFIFTFIVSCFKFLFFIFATWIIVYWFFYWVRIIKNKEILESIYEDLKIIKYLSNETFAFKVIPYTFIFLLFVCNSFLIIIIWTLTFSSVENSCNNKFKEWVKIQKEDKCFEAYYEKILKFEIEKEKEIKIDNHWLLLK